MIGTTLAAINYYDIPPKLKRAKRLFPKDKYKTVDFSNFFNDGFINIDMSAFFNVGEDYSIFVDEFKDASRYVKRLYPDSINLDFKINYNPILLTIVKQSLNTNQMSMSPYLSQIENTLFNIQTHHPDMAGVDMTIMDIKTILTVMLKLMQGGVVNINTDYTITGDFFTHQHIALPMTTIGNNGNYLADFSPLIVIN